MSGADRAELSSRLQDGGNTASSHSGAAAVATASCQKGLSRH